MLWGRAWIRWQMDDSVIAPVPLNIVYGIVREMWFRIRKGIVFGTECAYGRGYNDGFENGLYARYRK